jgi:ABC-type phosphate transport system substrate-binding protein
MRNRHLMVGVLALAGMVATVVVAVPSQANFTTGKCQGTNITGRGASFQATAQTAWKSEFENGFCSDVGIFPTVTYEPQGSGAGRRVVGERTGTNATGTQSRNQTPRFGATDEAPTTTGVSQMNQGTDTPGDEGTIHVIPAAVGAVAVPVNFPNNCDRSLLPDSAETNPASANSAPFIDRVRFTRTQFEEVWNGDSAHDQWTEIFPTLAADADCNVFITRVVRFDDSGTTFAFKDYLDHVNAARGWKTTYITGPDTRNWPNASVVARPDCAGSPQGPLGTHLTSGCANGNGSLVQKLLTVDGGIGYSDIATARANGYAITPGATRDDDIFWTQVPHPDGSFEEATADPNGYRTDGQNGANCAEATFTNVPSTTLGDWFPTTGADSPVAYGICTLTYLLAFDDYKGPYALEGCGNACEEQKARSVKDYLSSIVADGGQEVLFANDYGPLPENILNIARAGVNSICWDKPAGQCPGVSYGFARPRGATPLRVSLAVAYPPCVSPNRQHGAPLATLSCNPPTQQSGFLTVGTGDAHAGTTPNSVGSVRYDVKVGNAATPANDADVRVNASITDVRNQGSLTDYAGQVQVHTSARITDRFNGNSLTQPGTTQLTDFPVTVPCTTTPGVTTIGSTCAIATTFNAVIPNSILENKRSNWEFSQVVVNDGGSDGVVSTTPNGVFERQGLWIP